MHDGGVRTVLVVEDNPEIAWLARFHLTDAGHQVEVIGGEWRRLFDIATWIDVDVAVVDLSLGGDITGADVLRWLAEYLPGIRRVVFTASVTAHDADPYDEAVALGHAFVPKLDVVSKLVEAVDG